MSQNTRKPTHDDGVVEPDWRSHLQNNYQTYVSIAATILIALAPSLVPIKFEADPWLILRQASFVFLLIASVLLLFFVPKRMRSSLSELRGQLNSAESRQRKQALELVNALSMPINYFAEAASEGTALSDKREAMSKVRANLLTEAQNRLSSERYQVRVNLFVANPDQRSLQVPRGCAMGGPQSQRIFRPEDETYIAAVAGKGRVVEDCTSREDFSDILDTRGNFRYKSFSAFPVAVPGKLFAILAVDADVEGAFTEYDDKLMEFYTHLLSISFLYESWTNWIDI